MPNKTLIVPLLAGIFAHTSLAVFVVFLHRYFDVDLIKFWVGPFPFVSLFIAFVASLAFFVGLEQNSLTKTDLVFLASGMCVTAIYGIVLIYYFEYQTSWFSEELKISEILPFTDFLKMSFSSSSIKMAHQQDSEALRLGYFLPSFECLAYIFGGSCIGFGALRTKG